MINQMNQMQALMMRFNEQLNQANGVLSATARDRQVDRDTYQRLAEERLQTIFQMGETIRRLDETNYLLSNSYRQLCEELL
jgi:hypothetical protein